MNVLFVCCRKPREVYRPKSAKCTCMMDVQQLSVHLLHSLVISDKMQQLGRYKM